MKAAASAPPAIRVTNTSGKLVGGGEGVKSRAGAESAPNELGANQPHELASGKKDDNNKAGLEKMARTIHGRGL